MSEHDFLLSEFKLNPQLTLKNKIIMAPMTRSFASEDLVPTQAMADYYARRADAGLIITEGTVIAANASGYANVPGIFNEAQIQHWQQVTSQVHANHGKIFLQLWHVGRVSHPEFLNGELPVSASATTMTGTIARARHLTYGQSRAATIPEINAIIESFAEAAKNAIKAGFDGVEIHGANGYLVDQFLHYNTNLRSDDFGGTPEKMARFALEVVQACGEAIGFERVGIRLTPGTYLNEIVGDERDHQVFAYLLEQLNAFPIAYVHTGAFDDAVSYKELNGLTMTAFIRQHYRGTVIATGSYSIERAQEGLTKKEFNLVAFGRPFIANPDLVQRLRTNQPLKAYEATMLGTLY